MKWILASLLSLSAVAALDIPFEQRQTLLGDRPVKLLPLKPGKVAPQFNEVWFRKTNLYRFQIVDPQGQILLTRDAHTDEHDFRVTTAAPGPKDMHLFLLGCSFTFGDMVEDEDTVASYLAPKLREWQVYNLGRSGGSVNEAFSLWDKYDLRALGAPATGVMVFTLIDDHFERIVPTWRAMHWLPDFTPRYDLEDGRLVNERRLIDSWSKRWMNFLRDNGLSEYWLRLTSWSFEWEMRDADERMVAYLQELKRVYVEQFPKGRFVVTFHFADSHKLGTFPQLLDRAGIEFWRPPTLETVPAFSIPNNGHPTPYAYGIQGDFLLNHLRPIRSTVWPPAPGTR